MSKLQLRNLNKTYSTSVVPVKDLSLAVGDGEFLTLLGPSGCGKSTILRIIAGLEQPTRGEVLIGDRPVTHVPPGDRNIAMVFQSYALYPHLSVFDNIASGLKLRRVPPEEIRQRVASASEVLGLGNLLDRKPGQLSGGQRQRVALGRALVRQPEVFLLDEPLSNLDALLREQVRADLKQLFAAQQAPVVYVTHDQTEAMTLSTKVAVLNNGELQQLAPPAEIYSHPANRFVAGFVGSPQMNLFDLACENGFALLNDAKIPLPDRLKSLSAVTLGIRPEQVRLARTGDRTLINGSVFLTEHLGMNNLVSVRIPGTNDRVLRALLPMDAAWSSDEIALALPPEYLHWFDAETGDRL